MAIAHVASWTGANVTTPGAPSGTTQLLASLDTTGGDFIAIAVTNSANNIASISDNKGNTFSIAIGPLSNDGDFTTIYYAAGATCGAGHTISATFSSADNFVSIAGVVKSGMAIAAALDQTASGTGTGASFNSGSTATTTQADELIVGAGNLTESTQLTFSAGANFTMRSQSGQASACSTVYLEDRVVAATGTYDAPATSNTSDGRGWVALVATFKAAGGGAVVSLAGAAVASGGASGSLTHAVPLAAAAVAGTIGGGQLSLSVHFSGEAFVNALAAAQMAHGVPLAGGASAGAGAAGSLSAGVLLGGNAIAAAQAAAVLSLEVSLSGDAIAAVSASGPLTHAVPIAGDANASAQGSASLLGDASLSGAATAGAQGGGTLSLVVALTAQAVANALATGSLSISVRLSSDAIAQALAGGELTVLADVQLQGDAVASATGAAALGVGTGAVITHMQFLRLLSREAAFSVRSRSVSFRLN